MELLQDGKRAADCDVNDHPDLLSEKLKQVRSNRLKVNLRKLSHYYYSKDATMQRIVPHLRGISTQSRL